MRGIAVALVLFASACISSDSVMCATGHVCPAGSMCASDGRCLVPEQLAVCSGLTGREPCRFRGTDGVCVDGVCVSTSCGDGIVTGAEECDGGALGEHDDCEDLGYYEPIALVCGADCRYDRDACAPSGLCGDAIRNGAEVCDGEDLAKSNCLDLEFYESGPVTCNDACSYDTSACSGFCGDAVLNGPEVCEAGLPILESCVSYGYDRGHIGCSQCLPNISSCRFIGWRRLPITASTIIRSIHGTSRTDVFAAGSNGALLHWEGSRWTVMTAAQFDNFGAVFALAPGHVVALGQQGTIQRFDGNTWSLVSSNASWKFNAATVVGSSEAFAVGNMGVMRYDGTTWTTFSAPGATELTHVWGTGSAELYVIDTAGTLSHYNGSAWQSISLPQSATARAVWGMGPGAPYVAANNGSVYRRVGVNWSAIGALFGTINAGAATTTSAFCFVGAQSEVWCWDVGGALPTGSMLTMFPSVGDLGAIWASSADDVFVAGPTGIHHFQGSAWFNDAYPAAPLSYWGDDSVLYTANGSISRYNGVSSFAAVFTPPNGRALYGLWGAGPTDVFAVGQGGAIYRGSAGNWSPMTNADTRGLVAAWGSSATNVYAVGNAGAILRYTTSWNAVVSGTTVDLKDVWGSSSSDVFAVGLDGVIVRFNGTSFTPMVSGTTQHLRAVYGFAANNVYAVGDVGTLRHFDGTTWSAVPLGTGVKLNDVWGTSASDIFVVGDFGIMFHYDGTRWSPVKRPTNNYFAVHGFRNEIHVSRLGTNGDQLLRLAPW